MGLRQLGILSPISPTLPPNPHTDNSHTAAPAWRSCSLHNPSPQPPHPHNPCLDAPTTFEELLRQPSFVSGKIERRVLGSMKLPPPHSKSLNGYNNQLKTPTACQRSKTIRGRWVDEIPTKDATSLWTPQPHSRSDKGSATTKHHHSSEVDRDAVCEVDIDAICRISVQLLELTPFLGFNTLLGRE